MTNRVRFTATEVASNRFYQMPKFLFEGEFKEMSNDARVLYSLLRDRHELSLKNQWINENNEVYLCFTRKNMEAMLGLSDKTIKKSIEQLKEFGLLEEERIGLNQANRIYLTAVSIENSGVVKIPIPDTENFRFKTRKNSDSRAVKFPIQKSENFRPNDTNINNTDINKLNNNINKPCTEIPYTVKTDKPKKENNVVVDTKEKIESKLKTKINVKQLKRLLNEKSIETIEFYIDNFEKLTAGQNIGNKAGYFVDAVLNEYELPTKNNCKIGSKIVPQVGNFEQREYSKEYLEKLYSN